MGVFSRTSAFFGVDRVAVLAGFRLTTRGVRMPTCLTCGAVVAYESQAEHSEWHQRS
ncbi:MULTISPECIES: hypothetical protein [unclassified Aeromicrobium]|uniref:hypothetical protein n=1 Tax=unclassified Aeromicrobium TaxID=2633570 RepID=UPI000AB1D54C|nr:MULTISPECIES: hypothetical protein [unclassified Aeromicrobium]